MGGCLNFYLGNVPAEVSIINGLIYCWIPIVGVPLVCTSIFWICLSAIPVSMIAIKLLGNKDNK